SGRGAKPRLGGRILVVTAATGPSDQAVRAAALLARPDGGHSDVLITRTAAEAPLDAAALRDVEKRIHPHGFDREVRPEVVDLAEAVAKAMRREEPSLVIVDDPTFDASPGPVPVLVLDGVATAPEATRRLILEGAQSDAVAAEVARRLAPRSRGRAE